MKTQSYQGGNLELLSPPDAFIYHSLKITHFQQYVFCFYETILNLQFRSGKVKDACK